MQQDLNSIRRSFLGGLTGAHRSHNPSFQNADCFGNKVGEAMSRTSNTKGRTRRLTLRYADKDVELNRC
jgi:hypothetical protein